MSEGCLGHPFSIFNFTFSMFRLFLIFRDNSLSIGGNLNLLSATLLIFNLLMALMAGS